MLIAFLMTLFAAFNNTCFKQFPYLMVETLPLERFLECSQASPILDVRTPAEFARGHIPNATNLPLFTNEERSVVGTAYKQQSRQEAMLLGLDIVGGKMRSLVEAAQVLAERAQSRTLCVHCWRGGMRSGSVAWLLDLFGFRVATLQGGYKAFRRSVLDTFLERRNLLVLGGKTGSGKTHILHELERQGEQVIDLEALAHHKGSAFGALGEAPQPTQEQFENELAMRWRTLNVMRPVWLEDESRMTGRCSLPQGIWEQMRTANVLFLDIPVEERVHNTLADYGAFSDDELISSILKIQQRLGGASTTQAVEAVTQGNRAEAVRIVLRYYDKAYLHGLHKRDASRVHTLLSSTADVYHNAELVQARASQMFSLYHLPPLH
jgi:tRNA 2-selenouridine synthase